MKRLIYRYQCLAMALTILPLAAGAADFTVELEIPAMQTAEYHRPYIAIWVEDARRQPLAQLALWLEQEKWHRDLRSWWRRGGRKLALPIDGVSGATRKPGSYTIQQAAALPPGDYTLNVEAVREVGGREHLRIPFHWSGQRLQDSAQGESELGQITFTLEPGELP